MRVISFGLRCALVLVTPWPAAAQVHKCLDAQGRVEYRATPCAAGAGQPLPGAAARAAPVAAATPADADAFNKCRSLHAEVVDRRRRITNLDQLVRQLDNKLPDALTPGEAREYALQRQQHALHVEEAMRQGRVAGCERQGLRLGSAEAEAQELERRCAQLRDSAREWLDRHGRTSTKVAATLAAMRQERQEAGCKEP